MYNPTYTVLPIQAIHDWLHLIFIWPLVKMNKMRLISCNLNVPEFWPRDKRI